jgi:hypothetical protein
MIVLVGRMMMIQVVTIRTLHPRTFYHGVPIQT